VDSAVATTPEDSVREPGGDALAAADSQRVQRLKGLVFIGEMRAATTSGEFALRLRGAERPGLVDYEELCNRLNTFVERLEVQPPQPEVLSRDEAWRAQEELRLARARLEERLVEMTRVRRRGQEPEPEAAPEAPEEEPRGAPEPSKILLYLRDDRTVDIDSVLKESCSATRCSRDLWQRLRGKDAHGDDDWTQADEPPQVPSRVVEKQAALAHAKHELAKAQAMRAKILRLMDGTDKVGPADIDPQTKVGETKKLFRWDRIIIGRQILLVLANIELLFEIVAVELETQLRRATIQEWDAVGRQLKVLVFEFSLLDKQMAPFQRFVCEDPEVVRARGLDSDELRMLESHVARIAERLGARVDCIGQETSFFRPIRHQWSTVKRGLHKIGRGLMFYANGARLLYQDLLHAVKLMLKVAFLGYTLEPREVQTCYRAARDLFNLVPFLIILLIPLSPPGHVLVFSFIRKVYPDFFPSPFTERRQNVMRIYDEIKPVGERLKRWA